MKKKLEIKVYKRTTAHTGQCNGPYSTAVSHYSWQLNFFPTRFIPLMD